MSKSVSGESFRHVRAYAKRQREVLRFDASKLLIADNQYVAWIDLMGSGHIMSVSIAKSANFLARLHMAAKIAVDDSPDPVVTCPINDGIFLISRSKRAIMSVVRQVVFVLSGYFVSTPRPQDKFLLRGAIAYGPVYSGDDLNRGLSKTKAEKYGPAFKSVQFGPAIIQAFRHEAEAPPYGIAIHESARSFSPVGELPFRETHWLWWLPVDEVDFPSGAVSLRDMARCVRGDLDGHFEWMKEKAIFQSVDLESVGRWANSSRQYFSSA